MISNGIIPASKLLVNIERERAWKMLRRCCSSRCGVVTVTKKSAAIIRDLYNAGRFGTGTRLTYSEIAKATGLNQKMIYYIVGPKFQERRFKR